MRALERAPGAGDALEQELLRDLAIERFGLDLSPQRRAAVSARLRPRLAALRVKTLGDYYRHLRRLPEGVEEWGVFADVITNDETYLFRGGGQLDELVALLPALGRKGRPLRVLSAGCASGEEAYSLGAVLATHRRHLLDGFHVVGVDISTPRLSIAAAGRYPARAARGGDGAPRVLANGHFERAGDELIAGRDLRRHVTFRIGNLASPGGLGAGTFDVIFCRNVLIYAHDDGWPRFIRTLAGALEPDGYLFIGESEAFLGRDTPFVPRRLGNHFAHVFASCRSA